jgi:hypothetical protein
MSLLPERVDATHDIIYLAKRPLYEFLLERSAPTSQDPGSQSLLVQLRFTGASQQPSIALSLAALEQFHDDLGRLLDYVRQERARKAALAAPGNSTAGSMAPTPEPRDHEAQGHLFEASSPTLPPNRAVSIERLCNLSGIILTGCIALLSWALYSLSTGRSEFRPQQATAAQETHVLASAPARLFSADQTSGLPARTVTTEVPPSVTTSAEKVPADSVPHIYVHIQTPAQHEIAQRLVAQLEQNGYLIPEPAVLVTKGPSRTEVRYFRPTEAEEAAAIAMLLDQPHRAPATATYIRGRQDASRSGHRRYEVWLGPEPRSRKTAR